MKTKTIFTLSVCIMVIFAATCTVACPAPADVAHSTRSPVKSTYAVGDALTIVCNTCYEMSSGNGTLICTVSGSWLGTVPECTELSYEGPNKYIQKFYKSVSASSKWYIDYEAYYAVDGSMDTMAHTLTEQRPWFKLELCKPTPVVKVVLWNRPKCCSFQMANIDIKLDGTLCGHVDGPIELGSSAEVTCLDPSTGQPLYGEVITVQKTTTSIDHLSLTEIEVIGGESPCNPPEVPEYATINLDKTIYSSGDEIVYECWSCYHLTHGSASRICTYEGAWSGTPPVCTENDPYIPQAYENIATKENIHMRVLQSSDQSNETTAVNAVDGSMATVSITNAEPYPTWILDFCTPMAISTVNIWNRVDCCSENLNGTEVYVGGVSCGIIDSPLAKGSSAEFVCATPLTGEPLVGMRLAIRRQVTQGVLNLAEVQVFSFNPCPKLDIVLHSTKNLDKTYYSPGDVVTYKCDGCYESSLDDTSRRCTPLGTWDGSQPECTEKLEPGVTRDFAWFHRTVTQSSEDEGHPAELAIDESYETISSTLKEYQPWWSIQLCSKVLVHRVFVYNRYDCCADELQDFDVSVDGTLCGHASSPIALGDYHSVYCPGYGLNGTTVKIQKTSTTNETLAMGMVRIYTYPWAF